MRRTQQDVVTFKADRALVEAMNGIPNRSEFIRSAILAAMDGVCPLCKGTGILTPQQRHHWDEFTADHAVEECSDCHELRLVCSHDQPPRRRKGNNS